MATKGYPTYPFLPRITEDSLPFWQGCAQHELRYQRCTHCGKPRMPASFLCPDCLSPDFVWEPSSGRGTLYSFVVFHRSFHPALADRIPYAVAAVDLDEGVRLLTNLIDFDYDTTIKCGIVVEVGFVDAGNGIVLPVFHRI